MTPMEVHDKYGFFLDNLPTCTAVHVVSGDAHKVMPVDGIGEVGQFYSALSDADDNKVNGRSKGWSLPFDEVG